MLYTKLTRKAMVVSYKAHEGQLDKGGVPYIFHPYHVAEQMNSEYDICTALLHDVLEDTDCRLEDLKACGFPKEVLDAVVCLTRQKDQPYMEYIRIVATNEIATRVKLADLAHNSDETRLPGVDKEYHMELLNKYNEAREFLQSKK